MKITSYPTHYEVTPYVAGYNRDLEVNLSVWNKPYYRWEPLGYRIIGQTLYLPKGIDSEILSQTFRTQVFPGELYKERYVKKKYHMLLPPRDNLQKVAIDFIIGQGEYAYTRRQNQVAINLRPGDGKTYCTIHGIIESGRRALIITHASKIRSQWYDEFLKTTDVPESELMIVDGVSDMEKIITGDADADFFFINHQTLQSAERNKGINFIIDFFDKIQTGIKVYDEAHYEFASIVKLDMLSNIPKTYYLTATFRRTNSRENKIFGIVFASVFKFSNKMYEAALQGSISHDGDDSEVEMRKHTIYCPIEYNSHPLQENLMEMYNKLGLFSGFNYIKYELSNKYAFEKLHEALGLVFGMIKDTPGRILIVNPKVDCCELIKEVVHEICPNRSIGTIHSKNTKDDNIKNSSCDIIVSTIKSNGLGVNISKIRFLINLEPFSSTVIAEQLRGRLRPYSSTEYTYFFDLADIGVPKAAEFLKRRTRFYKKECAKVVHYKV